MQLYSLALHGSAHCAGTCETRVRHVFSVSRAAICPLALCMSLKITLSSSANQRASMCMASTRIKPSDKSSLTSNLGWWQGKKELELKNSTSASVQQRVPDGMALEQVQLMRAVGFLPSDITLEVWALHAQKEQILEQQHQSRATVVVSKPLCPRQNWVIVAADGPEAKAYKGHLKFAQEDKWRHFVNMPGMHWLGCCDQASHAVLCCCTLCYALGRLHALRVAVIFLIGLR